MGMCVVLRGVATLLAEDIRIQVLVHPSWEQRSCHLGRLLRAPNRRLPPFTFCPLYADPITTM
jgi:hypothetical protein